MPLPDYEGSRVAWDELLRILREDSILWQDIPEEYRFSEVSDYDSGNVSKEAPRLLACVRVVDDPIGRSIGRGGALSFDSMYGIRVYVYDDSSDPAERIRERDYLTRQVLRVLTKPENRSRRPFWSKSDFVSPGVTYNHTGVRCYSTIRYQTKAWSHPG